MIIFVKIADNSLSGCIAVVGASSPKKVRKGEYKICLNKGTILRLLDQRNEAKNPFDGKDLRYKKLDTGFVVYSVDEDGHDDGDKERTPRNKRKNESYTYDITFIIQR